MVRENPNMNDMDKRTSAWMSAMQGGGEDPMMYNALRWRLARRHQAPKVLYHYTSMDALHGILSTGRLWASDNRFANDRVEVSFAAELARETLRLKDNEVGTDGDKATALSVAIKHSVDNLQSVLPVQNFVVSLTPHRDDLSQWRGYGGERGAVAIGFDVGRLTGLMEQHAFHLSKVEYDKAAIDKLLAALTADYVMLANALFDVDIDRESVQQMMLKRFGKAVGAIAPCIKDASFQAESEWRFIGSGEFLFGTEVRATANARRLYAVTDLATSFRGGARYPIPYVSVPIRDSTGCQAVSEIVIGPTPDPATARLACTQLLRHFGAASCAIAESSVPYRNW